MINMERKVLKISSKEAAMKAGTITAMTSVRDDVCLGFVWNSPSKCNVQLCSSLFTSEPSDASPPHFCLLCSPIAVLFTVLSQFFIS